MVMKASSSTGDYHQSNHYSASNLVNRFNMNRGISTSSSLSTNIKVSSVFDHNNYDKRHHYDNYHEDYHHDNYDAAMATLPVVNSTAYITRIEVWLTNRTNNTENTRNVIAFADLGEAKEQNCQGNPGGYSTLQNPDNEANSLYGWATSQPQIRQLQQSCRMLQN
jgi:cell surface protein SprA